MRANWRVLARTAKSSRSNSARLGKSLQEALAAAAGATLVGSQTNGVLTLDVGGTYLHALPLGEALIDTEAADGVKLGADGAATVAVGGVVARFAPSVADLGQLARDMGGPFPWPGIEVTTNADGSVTATQGGHSLTLKSAMKLEGALAGTQLWWVEADGTLRLRHADGTSQGFAAE